MLVILNGETFQTAYSGHLVPLQSAAMQPVYLLMNHLPNVPPVHKLWPFFCIQLSVAAKNYNPVERHKCQESEKSFKDL